MSDEKVIYTCNYKIMEINLLIILEIFTTYIILYIIFL